MFRFGTFFAKWLQTFSFCAAFKQKTSFKVVQDRKPSGYATLFPGFRLVGSTKAKHWAQTPIPAEPLKMYHLANRIYGSNRVAEAIEFITDPDPSTKSLAGSIVVPAKGETAIDLLVPLSKCLLALQCKFHTEPLTTTSIDNDVDNLQKCFRSVLWKLDAQDKEPKFRSKLRFPAYEETQVVFVIVSPTGMTNPETTTTSGILSTTTSLDLPVYD